MDLLSDLNEAQRQAVTHIDGPLLVLAGAGSGKTRVITRRVAHMVQQGVPPWHVLALTFTNKAAGEMKARVEALGVQHGATVCTFHSLGVRLLREFAAPAGLPRNFVIYDSDDQAHVVKEAMKRLEIPTDRLPPARVHAAISRAKNQLQDAAAFAAAAEDFFDRKVAQVYTLYQQILKDNQALDFDDLLMRVAFLMRDVPDIRQHLGQRYRYILIDEYQDTNHAQYVIAHGIALDHENICATGDPDQSIYAWRGADIKNIMEFESDYPNALVVRLEENYRSTAPILNAASNLIAHNKRRKEKTLLATREGGKDVSVVRVDDERAEARFVAHAVAALRKDGVPYKHMAVFYRVNALSRVLEEGFRNGGIAYQIARGVEFYARKEIKDVLAYLRLMVNPADDVSCRRVINVPARGLGDTTIAKLAQAAEARRMGLLAVCQGVAAWVKSRHEARGTRHEATDNRQEAPGSRREGAKSPVQNSIFPPVGEHADAATPDGGDEASRALVPSASCLVPASDIGLNAGTAAKVAGFAALVAELTALADQNVPEVIGQVLQRTGIEKSLDDSEEQHQAVRNVQELVSAAQDFQEREPDAKLADYLYQVSLVSDIDAIDPTSGAVTLMTLHAAKGLEFPVVFMVGCEEGLMPFQRHDENSPADPEEERRLAFVGMTRAKDQLVMTHARYRRIRGQQTRMVESPFLGEIGEEGVWRMDKSAPEPAPRRPAVGVDEYNRYQSRSRDGFYEQVNERELIEAMEQADMIPEEFAAVRPGRRVRSPKFGPGWVLKVTHDGQQTRATVNFDSFGVKVIVLQQGRLEIL